MALTDLLNADFFEHTWHREPMLWRRGAAAFLGPSSVGDRVLTIDDTVIDQWVAAAKHGKLQGQTLLRERLGVTFLEGVRAAPVDGLVAEGQALFDTTEVWFDVVRTIGLGSIGSHFDDSDNFVVQLRGVKQWRLADAMVVPEPQRERRLAGDATAAAFPIDTPSWEATARAGDVVYLPFGWPHHGIARTPSMSISLVVR